MADKEEIAQNNRIINAEKYKRRIKKGRIYIDVRDKKLNCLLSKVYSRQEAIERMAKGLCSENLSHSCEDCMRNGTNDCFINEKEDFYKSLAEAALNALLENNK